MELLDQATLVGLKTYMWDEETAYQNVPTCHALFVIRRAEDKLVRRVLPFRVDGITFYGSDGHPFRAITRPQAPALMSIISSLLLFEGRLVQKLAREVDLLLYSSFRFTPYPPHSPRSPRLVVVADLSFTEVGYRPLQPLAPPEENAGVGIQQPEHGDNVSDMVEDDLSYDDEMMEILEKLRMLYVPAGVYPLEPPYPTDPTVLREQKLKLEIGLYKEAEEPSDCAVCFNTLAAGEIVLKTGCGHVFHKTCSIPWFSAAFTCPMCRAGTFTIL